MWCPSDDKIGFTQWSVSQIPWTRDCINKPHLVKEVYATLVDTPEAFFSQTTFLWITATDYSAGSHQPQGYKDKVRTQTDIERNNIADQWSLKSINLNVDHSAQDKWLIYSTTRRTFAKPTTIL